MSTYSRAVGADSINQIEKRLRLLKRQLNPYLTQLSPDQGILWQQAQQFQRQRRYRAAEIMLLVLQSKIGK